jgi:cytidylate kinase
MGNALLSYLNKRLEESQAFHKGSKGAAGPVITISREVGCNGLVLARMLATRLNQQRMISEWKVYSKEVFYKSAQELNLDPNKVQKMFKTTDRYTFEEILKALGEKRYKSEAKIAKTVRDVVRSLAIDGFAIIVGRASHIIARDIKNALHLRLTAPLEYRIATIMENNQLKREDAITFINRVEQERRAFRKALREENLHEDYFDMTINRASFSTEQAVELILLALEKKKVLNDYTYKVEFF